MRRVRHLTIMVTYIQEAMIKRRYTRYQPEPNSIAQLDLKPAPGTFTPTVVGLVLDEAYGGAGVVISTRYGVREGIKIKAKIGDLEPINAEVVWVIRLDKDVAKIGLRFDDQK